MNREEIKDWLEKLELHGFEDCTVRDLLIILEEEEQTR